MAPHLFSPPLSRKPDLFQRLVSFMADLREADGLLQRAIEKVDERSKLDTAQVQHTRMSSGTMPSGSLHLLARGLFCWGVGGAAVHRGAEVFDERGAGRCSAGYAAERRRGRAGQDEERGLPLSTV